MKMILDLHLCSCIPIFTYLLFKNVETNQFHKTKGCPKEKFYIWWPLVLGNQSNIQGTAPCSPWACFYSSFSSHLIYELLPQFSLHHISVMFTQLSLISGLASLPRVTSRIVYLVESTYRPHNISGIFIPSGTALGADSQKRQSDTQEQHLFFQSSCTCIHLPRIHLTSLGAQRVVSSQLTL